MLWNTGGLEGDSNRLINAQVDGKVLLNKSVQEESTDGQGKRG